MGMMRLAHLSDPHIGPLPKPRPHELASKRIIGYLNWHGNRTGAMLPEVLTELIADIKAGRPDHIVVTGDIVNLSLAAEMPMARAWFASLGEPDEVSIVPGNHDAYVPGAVARAGRLWRDYMADDIAHHHADPRGPDPELRQQPDHTPFPYVRRRGAVAIVGTSSARASMPGMASGYFDQSQAIRLKDTLKHLGHEGAFRVVLIHHPPTRERGDWYRRLAGSARFRAAIAEAGAELVLHGHTHRPTVAAIKTDRGPVPVVGVACASQAPGHHATPARYNLFEISGRPGHWSCEMIARGFRDRHSGVVELARRALHGPAADLT